jgi:hypothetical protein
METTTMKSSVREKDTILRALKNDYFRKLRKENWPKTPELSKEIDDLDYAIRKRKQEILLDSYEDTV